MTLVLADGKILNNDEYLHEQRLLRCQIKEQELLMSQARKLFLKSEIDIDDFKSIKTEYNTISNELNTELGEISGKISANTEFECLKPVSFPNIFHCYKSQELEDKRILISLLSPQNNNSEIIDFGPLKLNDALSKILVTNIGAVSPNSVKQSPSFKI